MFKRFSRTALLAIIASLGLISTATPANAAVVAAGEVAGTVNITSNPGLDLTCRPTTFSFAPILLTGVITVNASTYAGPITTSSTTGASGTGKGLPHTCPAGTDSTASGQGNVNGVTIGGTNGLGATISGNCSAITYIRLVDKVVVNLRCTVTVNGSTGTVDIKIEAEFVPAPGQDGVTVPVKTATFAGTFEGASAP